MKLPSNVSKGEKATADWANDVVNALRSLQPCPSTDIGFVHTPNGWTAFLVDKPVYSRPPKLWKMSFGELQLDPVTLMFRVVKVLSDEIVKVLSNPEIIYNTIIGYFDKLIEIIMNPDYNGDGTFTVDDILSQIDAIVDSILLPIINEVDSKVEEICGNIAPIGDALSAFFEKQFPQDGDYIYTEELGICYIIFQETKEKYPTPNLIFRVAFTVGGSRYYAVTPFPFPDIAECVKTLLMSVVNWIKSFIGSSLEGMVNAIISMVNGIISKLLSVEEALENAMEAANAALEAGMDTISDLANEAMGIANAASNAASNAFNQISNVRGMYDDLRSDLGDAEDGIGLLDGELDDIKTNYDQLKSSLNDAQKDIKEVKQNADAFKEFEKNLTTITVLLRDGMSQIVKVSSTSAASSFATFKEVEMCEDGKAVKRELLMKNGN